MDAWRTRHLVLIGFSPFRAPVAKRRRYLAFAAAVFLAGAIRQSRLWARWERLPNVSIASGKSIRRRKSLPDPSVSRQSFALQGFQLAGNLG
jgi:hypothetical protein